MTFGKHNLHDSILKAAAELGRDVGRKADTSFTRACITTDMLRQVTLSEEEMSGHDKLELSATMRANAVLALLVPLVAGIRIVAAESGMSDDKAQEAAKRDLGRLLATIQAAAIKAGNSLYGEYKADMQHGESMDEKLGELDELDHAEPDSAIRDMVASLFSTGGKS